MKTIFFFVWSMMAVPVFAMGEVDPDVRVLKNDLTKIYTVVFSDSLEQQVHIYVKDTKGKTLTEAEFTGKSFAKHFKLENLPYGEYQIIIQGAQFELLETIQIRSEKQVMDESISIKGDYPHLFINATRYNLNPMNIMLHNMDGKLLQMIPWEPNNEEMTKQVDLSGFEGYELKVEIVQDGKTFLEDVINLY